MQSIWLADLPVDTLLLFRSFDEARSAVGPFLLGVQWLGTHYQTLSVIHRSVAVALGTAPKQYFSRDINVFSMIRDVYISLYKSNVFARY